MKEPPRACSSWEEGKGQPLGTKSGYTVSTKCTDDFNVEIMDRDPDDPWWTHRVCSEILTGGDKLL